jgi:hypothetical protein
MKDTLLILLHSFLLEFQTQFNVFSKPWTHLISYVPLTSERQVSDAATPSCIICTVALPVLWGYIRTISNWYHCQLVRHLVLLINSITKTIINTDCVTLQPNLRQYTIQFPQIRLDCYYSVNNILFYPISETLLCILNHIHYKAVRSIGTNNYNVLFIHSSIALQPFVGPWRLLQFRKLFTQSVGLLG